MINHLEIFMAFLLQHLKIEKKNFDNMMDYSKDQLNVYLSYANKKNCDVDFNKINKFKWI